MHQAESGVRLNVTLWKL